MKDLEFENIFGILGIKSLDMYYLKEMLQTQFRIMISDLKTKDKFDIFELQRLKSQYQELQDQARAQNKSIDEIRAQKVEETSGKKYQDVTVENIEKYEKIVSDNDVSHKENSLREYANQLMSSNDLYLVLYHLSKIKLYNLRRNVKPNRNDSVKKIEEKRQKEDLYTQISDIFSSPEAIQKYINYNVFILSYVDVEKSDMSSNRYIPRRSLLEGESNIPDYVYEINLYKNPEQLLKKMPKEYSKDLKVSKFGEFSFGSFIRNDRKATVKMGPYDIIGVSRKNERGQDEYYHLIMEFNPNFDPQMFHDVVFTDIVMKNAMNNNFGYIGAIRNVTRVIKDYSEGLDSPILRDESVNMLCYDTVGAKDLVTALSFAMRNDGRINNKDLNNLADVYRYVDESMILSKKAPEDFVGDGR